MRSSLVRLILFGRDESGGVAVMGAVFLLVALICAAIAADLGSVYFVRREQQGATDIAAMLAARNISKANAVATNSLAVNGVQPTRPMVLVLGNYRPDKSLPLGKRFTPNGTPRNAVSVTVEANAPLYFGKLFRQDAVEVVTRSVAATRAMAAFSVGSRLASLDGGILNQVLGETLGGHAWLSLMDYNALASARVGVFGFLDGLATEAGITAVDYSDILDSGVTMGNVLRAMAGAGMTGTAKAAMLGLASSTNARTVGVKAGDIIDLGPYGSLGVGENAGMDAAVNALSLLTGSAMAANGDHQIDLDLGGGIPGLVAVTASVTIGERPQGSSWFTIGGEGSSVYTAQTRIRLDATVDGPGLLLGARVRVPILVDVASAAVTARSIWCGDNPRSDADVGLDAWPAVADLWIGEPTSPAAWGSFGARPTVGEARITKVPLIVTAYASGHVAVTNTAATGLEFSWNDVANHKVKTVSTRDPVTTLVSSLVANTDIRVATAGFGLSTGGLTSLLGDALSPIGPTLDPILMSLLDALGIRIGEADVMVNGLRCDGSTLVN